MTDTILKLIEEEKIIEATRILSNEIEKKGLDDTRAILLATINARLGDMESYISAIESGLEYNPANYELWLMKADYYSLDNVPVAFDCYETSLQYARYQVGIESKDYIYIENVLMDFKSKNEPAINDYKNSLPIVIYKSEPICYGVLNHFADLFANALIDLGEKIEMIDVNETPPERLTSYCGKRFKAIFGIQTYLFSIKFNDGRNIHDFIFGPKFNMIFDHPACMYNHLTNGPSDYTVLTHDRNYVEFAKRYYPMLKSVKLFAPAGEESNASCQKEYDFIFVGSYKSPDTWNGVIEDLDKKYSGCATKLIEMMTNNPNLLYEDCVRKILGEDVESIVFFELKQTYFVVMSYYRQKIIKTLLENEIKLDVFGDSWKTKEFCKYTNLVVHDELSPKESIDVYKKSNMSLNIMSWHKDGRTERVANSMLNGSLVISDKCDYLSEEYEDGKDIVLFDLEKIELLPKRLKALLDNPIEIEKMSQRAYEKAKQKETWENRAKDFIIL